mgnify:CR=1 FL=1
MQFAQLLILYGFGSNIIYFRNVMHFSYKNLTSQKILIFDVIYKKNTVSKYANDPAIFDGNWLR